MTKWPITPHSGWHYLEGETRIEADSFEQLADNLASYRAANHLPAGDPKSDIENYIASKWPHVLGLRDSQPNGNERDSRKPAAAQFASRVGAWCYNRFSRLGAIAFVSEEIAQQREGVCVSCPANSPHWKRAAISSHPDSRSSVEATEVLAYKLRRGRETQRQSKLGACKICAQENGVAVHLGESALNHRAHYLSALPEFCWLKRLPKLSSTDTSTALAEKIAEPISNHANPVH